MRNRGGEGEEWGNSLIKAAFPRMLFSRQQDELPRACALCWCCPKTIARCRSRYNACTAGGQRELPAQRWQGARRARKERSLARRGQVVTRAPPPRKMDCVFSATDAPLLRKTSGHCHWVLAWLRLFRDQRGEDTVSPFPSLTLKKNTQPRFYGRSTFVSVNCNVSQNKQATVETTCSLHLSV